LLPARNTSVPVPASYSLLASHSVEMDVSVHPGADTEFSPYGIRYNVLD